MRPRSNRVSTAFSLVELLVVVAVIAILMTLIVPAVSNFGRATGLVTGGNLVTNLAGFARQNAMTKNTMTALVMLGEQDTAADYRAFTVLEYNTGRGWSQISAWQNLPAGILVDRKGEDDSTDHGTFLKHFDKPFPFITGPPKQDDPPVRYNGKKVKAYAARIFMPGGNLQNPQKPAQLRLVEGFLRDGLVTYTRPGRDDEPSNFYDIAIVGATGVAKVSRP